MKFRKKPVVIDAIQFTGTNAWDCQKFMGTENPNVLWLQPHACIEIFTLEGTMTALIGDWIIKGVKGEFYPCKPDIFAATYEPA